MKDNVEAGFGLDKAAARALESMRHRENENLEDWAQTLAESLASVDWHHVDLSRLPEPEAEADRIERLHPAGLPLAICLGSVEERPAC